jgi:succinate-acetate transporter protein
MEPISSSLQKPIEGLCCTGTFNAVLTGIEGVICGLSAVYLAIAEVLNETYGRTVLPICPTN